MMTPVGGRSRGWWAGPSFAEVVERAVGFVHHGVEAAVAVEAGEAWVPAGSLPIESESTMLGSGWAKSGAVGVPSLWRSS